MPTAAEIAHMTTLKNAARSATKFFKKVKPVKSTNNPFACTTAADQATLESCRAEAYHVNTIVGTFDNAATTGIGNCDEKGRICYAALVGNPLLANSQVTLCSVINYDHIFVVVANNAVGGPTNLPQLGLTAMIVDGWSEDWYFPNLQWYHSKWYGLGNTPNPLQLYVRVQIERHQFQTYDYGP
ncbi:MAG: hypothetical protein ABW166_06560 [Sedimenticola sp.]